MKLPNGERADLGTKLEDYSLNPQHRLGQHKARVFESLLGINLANKEILAAALLDAAAKRVRLKPRATTASGRRLSCDFR